MYCFMFYYVIPYSIYFEQACQIIHQKILINFKCWFREAVLKKLNQYPGDWKLLEVPSKKKF